MFVWLLTGIVLFSAMARLHPRYVESFTPAVAGHVRDRRGRWWRARAGELAGLAVPLTALLAVPLVASVEAVEDHSTDAGNVGAMGAKRAGALSAYLRAHQGAARYELAAASATTVASLIVADRRPVLMLTTYNARPFTSVPELRAADRAREKCATPTSTRSAAATRPRRRPAAPPPRAGWPRTPPTSHARPGCAAGCCGGCPESPRPLGSVAWRP